MSSFKTSDGLTLAYSDEGAGQPVLCLPGLTRDKSDFDDMAAIIGEEARLIRLTSRGRKGSDHDPEPLNYTVPVEARDAVELLDHLGVQKALIVGTSRGGMLAMFLAATARARLSGVLLNDIGPQLEAAGIDRILAYLGKQPSFKTYAEAADALLRENSAGFPGVSRARWLNCARRWWQDAPDGLQITYDAKIRDGLVAGTAKPDPDLWPLFDALAGIPLALLRAANSDLLSAETAAEMCRRRPDMIFAEVPDRAHVPFLDEAESIAAVRELLARVPP